VQRPDHAIARRHDEALAAVGLAIAIFGPLVLAALCVPLREDVAPANLALAFVVVVALAGACGGRRAGAIAAVLSTLAYDSFLTRPYGSLKIDRAADVETVILLLVVGLLASELMALASRYRAASSRSRSGIDRLHRVAGLAAAGADTADVVQAVRAELLGLLSLRDCTFEAPPFAGEPPTIARDGSIEGGHRQWTGGELSLPAEGAVIEVVGRGASFGRFMLVPDWNVGVPLEDRVVAVTLVDQLGAALASQAKPLSRGEGPH
jgi:hypothetical protein